MEESVELEPITLPNGWSHRIARRAVTLPKAATDEGIQIANEWAKHYPTAKTWVSERYGVPSLFIRFDAVWRDGRWEIIEIEDRPCGMGATGLFNERFKESRDAFMRRWPSFGWVGSLNRVSDDDLWLGKPMSLAEALLASCGVLVRARPEDAAYHPLRVHSVSTVHDEGDKRPLVKLGYGSVVRWIAEGGSGEHDGYIEGLPNAPCVVKPLRGTRARHVFIHGVTREQVPSKRSGDTRGIDAIDAKVKAYGEMLAQRFIVPLELEHLPGHNVMYRLFFGYDPEAATYLPMHGAYVADTSLMLHGTERTIFGPLIVN